MVQEKRGSISQTWRLRPGMNFGPLAPCFKAVRANAIYDPNLKKFVGEPVAAVVEEVAP